MLQNDAPVQVVVPQECSDALERSLRPGNGVTVRVALEDHTNNDELHHVFRLGDVSAEGKTRSHVRGGVVPEAESVNGKTRVKKKDR